MVLCMVCGWAQKKDVVWNTPSALSDLGSSSATFSVTKVELKDNETVVRIHAEFIPHFWIKFTSDSFLQTSDGKQYGIISGKADLAFHFQPVPKDTKEIDFIEGYGEGAFRFWNIHEKRKNVLPKELQNMKYKKAEVLPDAKIHKGTATVKFQMVGYKPEMNLKAAIYGMKPLASSEDLEMEVPFNNQGIAVAEIPLHLVRTAYFNVANVKNAKCLIAPDETTEYIIVPDAEEKERLLFNGFMARTNTEVYREGIKSDNDAAIYDAIQTCTTSKERVDFFESRMRSAIENINKRKDLAESSKQMMRMAAERDFREWLSTFVNKYHDLLVRMKKIPKVSTSDEYTDFFWKYDSYIDIADSKKAYDYEYECFTAPYATCSPDYWRFYPRKVIGRNTPKRELTLNESIFGVFFLYIYYI